MSRKIIYRLWLALAIPALFLSSWRFMDLLGDSFWSIALGRWMIEHVSLPEGEPFSYAASEGPWLSNMPLTQVVLYLVEHRLGLTGVLAFGALVLTVALALTWIPHAKTDGARAWGLALCAASVFAQRDELCVRGQLFGDLWFALLLLWLYRLHDGKKASPVWGLALGALWVNTHPSFLYAFPFLGAAFVGRALRVNWGADKSATISLRTREALPVAGFAGCLAAGTLINPYLYRLPVFAVELFAMPSTQSINLFLPPSFSQPEVIVALAFGVGLTAYGMVRKSKGSPFDSALLLLALVAAANSMRLLGPLLMLEVVVACRILSRIQVQIRIWPRARHAVLWLWPFILFAVSFPTTKSATANVPVEAAAFIEQNRLPDPVMNVYHWGGYLDYAWYGKRKIFIDGRNYRFENGTYEAYLRLWSGSENWREELDRYASNTVLWERGTFLDMALTQSPDWVPVFREGFAVVFVRRSALPRSR